jgi:hypothetical protein
MMPLEASASKISVDSWFNATAVEKSTSIHLENLPFCRERTH